MVASNLFSGNSVNGNGGAVYVTGGASLQLSANTITGSSANDGRTDYATYGGGIYVSHSGTLTLMDNTITHNTSDSAAHGGGAYIKQSGAASWMAIEENTVLENGCLDGPGGGFYLDGYTIALRNNVIGRNNASTGDGEGAGIWVKSRTRLDLVNNTVVENATTANGGGIRFVVDGTTEILSVYNNIIWGNTATGDGGDVYLSGFGSRKEFCYNDAHDMYGVWDYAVSNIDVNPVFFDPVNDDYHLRFGSPCINVGDNTATNLPATDMDGGPRIQDGVVDLGAYEFNNTDFHPADVNENWDLEAGEFTAYAAAWKNDQAWATGPNPIPADYVTRAGYLKENGGTYHNDGGGKPVCWKIGAAP